MFKTASTKRTKNNLNRTLEEISFAYQTLINPQLTILATLGMVVVAKVLLISISAIKMDIMVEKGCQDQTFKTPVEIQ